MVRSQVDRGIIRSISSKNDFNTTKAEFEKLGIGGMFVFQHIDWTPKGQAEASKPLSQARLPAGRVA